MTYSPELRDELKSRLQRLSDEKLLLGNPERLRQLAAEAVEMSRLVGPPWKQLAEYRFAHVLLRQPSVTEDHAEETARLKQIEEHFKLAANYEQERLFGPLPYIYLIAVLNRLMKHDQDNAADYQQKIERHFETAARLTSQLDLIVPSSNESETGPLQQHSFNLLELVSYCLDLDYRVLSGQGGLSHENRFLNGYWCIFSNDPTVQAIPYDLEFGLAELEEILASNPDSVGFIYGNATTVRNGWKYGRQKDMDHEVNDDYLKLLSIILAEPSLAERSNTAARNQYFAYLEADACRQIKRRCKKALQTLTGMGAEKIFPSTSFGLEIPIYGLINRAALRLQA
jgi:hypothetical protein